MTPACIVCYPSILNFTAISEQIPFKIAYADKKKLCNNFVEVLYWGIFFFLSHFVRSLGLN